MNTEVLGWWGLQMAVLSLSLTNGDIVFNEWITASVFHIVCER